MKCRGRTAVEAAGNFHTDDLECEEGGHGEKDTARLFVDGVHADDMDDGAGGLGLRCRWA